MGDLKAIAAAVSHEPYSRWLGVSVERIEPDSARVEIPYKEQNSNPGRQVHGGVVASALNIAARMAALSNAKAPEPFVASTLNLNIGYLSAAIGEDISAEAQVLRRGKELCYVRSEVTTPAGKPIGTATVVYRAAPGADPPPRSVPIDRAGDEFSEVSSLTRMLSSGGFISGLGIEPEHMKDGLARLRLPFRDSSRDAAGNLHEGALAALIEICGSLSAWSLVVPRPGMRPSTVAIDINFLAATRTDVIARSRNVGHKREIFFNEVEAESTDGVLVARGSVIYRIVRPE